MSNIDDCKYNKMVECPPSCRNCTNCGWNPAVVAKRAAQTRRILSRKEVEQNA